MHKLKDTRTRFIRKLQKYTIKSNKTKLKSKSHGTAFMSLTTLSANCTLKQYYNLSFIITRFNVCKVIGLCLTVLLTFVLKNDVSAFMDRRIQVQL